MLESLEKVYKKQPDFKIGQQAKAVNMEFARGQLCGRVADLNVISNSNNLLNRLIAIVEVFPYLNGILGWCGKCLEFYPWPAKMRVLLFRLA